MGYVEEIRALVGHRPLILVGAVAVIVNEEGKILLQQRKHPEGAWAIPGGLMELGESVEETAKREVCEETNLTIGELHLINVYSGPGQFLRAPNGDEFYAVTIAFYTQDYSGELRIDAEESLDFKFFHPNEFPDRIVNSHQTILQEFLEKKY